MAEAQRNIVIAAEDSEASERACQWAADNLLRTEDVVHLLHVVEIPVSDLPVGTDDMGFVPKDLTAARILTENARGFIISKFMPRVSGHKHQVEVVDFNTEAGAVGEVLCEPRQSLNASALVMASHDKGFLKRLFLGSTSMYCCQHCLQPLVIVR